LARGLALAIDVEDDSLSAYSITQRAYLPLFALPTGCATSFNLSVIWLDSMLLDSSASRKQRDL